MTESDGYVLGRAPAELDRLRLQAEIYAPHTEHLLTLAGLEPGMRVLDIGCGAGDVTTIAARLVGPTGSVLGIDMNAEVLEVARANAAGLDNVSFQHATVPDIELDGSVDALIGRLILVHLPDPVDTVRKLSARVRPGGVVTFQELSAHNARSEPETPLVTQAYRWVDETLRTRGARPAGGQGLHRVLRDAGFDRVGAAMEIPTGNTKFQIPYFVSGTINSMLPTIEATGVATRAEIDIDTLADRIIAELDEYRALLWPPELTAVWARVGDR